MWLPYWLINDEQSSHANLRQSMWVWKGSLDVGSLCPVSTRRLENQVSPVSIGDIYLLMRYLNLVKMGFDYKCYTRAESSLMIGTWPHCTEVFSVYILKNSKRAHLEANSSDCKRAYLYDQILSNMSAHKATHSRKAFLIISVANLKFEMVTMSNPTCGSVDFMYSTWTEFCFECKFPFSSYKQRIDKICDCKLLQWN